MYFFFVWIQWPFANRCNPLVTDYIKLVFDGAWLDDTAGVGVIVQSGVGKPQPVADESKARVLIRWS